MKMHKTKELLIIALLFAAAAAGWYAFMFVQVKAKNERISDLRNQIDARTAEESTLHSRKELVADTASLHEKLKSYFVAAEGSVSVIELLETVGNEVGILVETRKVETNAIAKSETAELLRLTLIATGTWSNTLRFLGLIELLPYEARIGQMILSRAQAEGAGPWRADITLEILKDKQIRKP